MAKHPGGRPTKYKESMCQILINEMKEGASQTEVCATLGISEDTFYNWKKDPKKPEFSEAIKVGNGLSSAWWQRMGRKNLENKEFNATLWYMNMKNRHGWADKKEIKHEGEASRVVIEIPKEGK